MLAYPAASCGDRGRIPSGCAIMSGPYITGKPRCAESGFNARAIVFKRAMESHVFFRGSERTHRDRPAAMGNRSRAFPDKLTGKVCPPFSPADG